MPVDWATAEREPDFDGHPGTVYVRAEDASVAAVRDVLGRTLNPWQPNEAAVARRPEALTAKRPTDNSFSALFLGLGGAAAR